jgi:hypothetical protein
MTNYKIQITSAFVASLLAITSSIQIANAQENQTEVQGSTQIEGSIDQLLQVHPVLSELMQEDDTGVIEYLSGLETQEAVQTLLALESLQDLVKLQTLHMIVEGLGNQTGPGNQTGLGNQTGT